jgi:hypothetical protein
MKSLHFAAAQGNDPQSRSKPGLSHVAAQWAVRGHQDIQAQVKLPPTDEQRIVDVERDHISFLCGLRHKPAHARESKLDGKRYHIKGKSTEEGTDTLMSPKSETSALQKTLSRVQTQGTTERQYSQRLIEGACCSKYTKNS